MTAFILRRLWQMIPTLLGVVLLVFFLFNWVGGDPAYVLAGKISNPEQIANIRRQLGIDQPYWVHGGFRHQLEHQRKRGQHHRQPSWPLAHRPRAAANP